MRPIRNRTQGQLTSPIRHNSLILRFHARTINESNQENFLAFKAPRRTINESNPEQLLNFKAPHGDDPQTMSPIWNTSSFLGLHARTNMNRRKIQSTLPIGNTFLGWRKGVGGGRGLKTDHVNSGPMRGLRINCIRWDNIQHSR